MMTGTPGCFSCSALSSPMPSIPSMRRSEMTASGRRAWICWSAAAALSAASTLKPYCESRMLMRRSSPGSSSTIRMRPFGLTLAFAFD
jgi:hypothetical protein